MPKHWIRDAILVGALLIGWLFMDATSLRKGLEAENRLAAKRLQETMGALIQKAHQTKDDLAIQEMIQTLAQAPGVLLACVVDQNGKITSHNQPSQIGKTFHRSPAPNDFWAWPLQDKKTIWGTLIFSTSNQSSRALCYKQLLTRLIACASLWGGFIGWSLIWEKRIDQIHSAIFECEALLTEEKGKYARLEERSQKSESLAAARLQTAVDRIPQALMLLDQKQRVAAVNQSAAKSFGAESKSSLVGKSWQEVPCLRDCGQALEQSLASPGQPIEWPNGGLRLKFETSLDCSAGTWISLA